MLIPELFKQIQVSPRVAFWVSVSALAIVLFNDHVYLTGVQAREKTALMQMQRNIEEETNLAKRERILETWEAQLISRENEYRLLMMSGAKAKASQ